MRVKVREEKGLTALQTRMWGRGKDKGSDSWSNRWSNLTPHPWHPEAPCPRLSNPWTLRNFSFYCPERRRLKEASERMNFAFASKLKLNTHI